MSNFYLRHAKAMFRKYCIVWINNDGSTKKCWSFVNCMRL